MDKTDKLSERLKMLMINNVEKIRNKKETDIIKSDKQSSPMSIPRLMSETKKDESLAIRNELEKKDMELQNELIPILENPKSPSLSSVASDKPKDCNPATYHGLHEWHKYMFEKLGWMMLSINKGNQNPEKITSYKNSIDLLLCALDKKITNDSLLRFLFFICD